ncbi:PTS sugar transporter subunit IIA [Enterococcus sp. ALS3]|uniref:PTS sugar transporter subunit IIA n=1 Tax=Enterococcus alishanensis TaxID=1303817 RepID=A0ABS6TGP8_9ENTE|nr:PTS sugar transporter subunit IIA [Enterococcus alishanensis]
MERKILIATHGEMAKGLQSSLNVLAGKGESIEVINAYMTDTDYTPEIIQFIETINEEDQAIIFTDLYGGSVNQKVVTEVLQAKRNNIFIVSNANLAIILSLMFLAEDQVITDEIIEDAIKESQVQLVKINQTQEEDSIF